MATSPTETEFLAAIRADKADDLPRLVFADWLEETGEPDNVARAEFIRLGCELVRKFSERGCLGIAGEPQCGLRGCPKCTRLHAINNRIQDLYQALGLKRALFVLSGTTVADWSFNQPVTPDREGRFEIASLAPQWFRRGFIYKLYVSYDFFRQNAAAIFRANPVEWVTITDAGSLNLQFVDATGNEAAPPDPRYRDGILSAAWTLPDSGQKKENPSERTKTPFRPGFPPESRGD